MHAHTLFDNHIVCCQFSVVFIVFKSWLVYEEEVITKFYSSVNDYTVLFNHNQVLWQHMHLSSDKLKYTHMYTVCIRDVHYL